MPLPTTICIRRLPAALDSPRRHKLPLNESLLLPIDAGKTKALVSFYEQLKSRTLMNYFELDFIKGTPLKHKLDLYDLLFMNEKFIALFLSLVEQCIKTNKNV